MSCQLTAEARRRELCWRRPMKRATVLVKDDAKRELLLRSEDAKGLGEQSLSSALKRRSASAARHRSPGLTLKFLAAGRSGCRKTACRHEALLFRDKNPHGSVLRKREKPASESAALSP